MSREIKFRAWDSYQKIMFYDCDTIRIGLNGLIYFGRDWDGNMTEITTPLLKLMQFTGLKDKKGKEIYEGDIANIKYKKVLSIKPTDDQKIYVDGDVLEYVERGVMQFNEKDGQFSFLCKDSLLEDEHIGLTIEIIGNIYESKHLLNE